MTPEISEFSYGFALTNEIVGWIGLKAAPIFPSLVEEGKAGGGYDVKLDAPGIPLYLQFKRADCMTRRTATEISKHKLPLDVPFFRFPITQMGKSDQHALLLELDDGTNAVFYAAPRFHTLSQINEAWSTKSVAARSIFVRPSVIGSLDGDAHRVAYDDSITYLCSEPTHLAFHTATEIANQLTTRLAAENLPLRETLPRFSSSLAAAWDRAVQRRSTIEAIGRTALEKMLAGLTLPTTIRGVERDLSLDFTRVPTRDARPLEGHSDGLRRLADDALKLFNAQLIVVQQSN